MILYFIRHGLTTAMPQHLNCGWTDVHLSQPGIDRLKQMKAAGGYPDITGLKVYVSGLVRTIETLQALYGDIEYEVMPQFKEINFGDYENQVLPVFKDLDNPFTDMKVPFPNGESWQQVTDRGCEGIRILLQRHQDCLLVGHGGQSSMLLGRMWPQAVTSADGRPQVIKCGCGVKMVWNNDRIVAVEGLPAGCEYTEDLK